MHTPTPSPEAEATTTATTTTALTATASSARAIPKAAATISVQHVFAPLLAHVVCGAEGEPVVRPNCGVLDDEHERDSLQVEEPPALGGLQRKDKQGE